MPFCPKCREEYDDGVAQCFDCGTPLVAALGAGGAAPEPGGGARPQPGEQYVVFMAAEAADRDAMLRALEQWEIPVKKLEEMPNLHEQQHREEQDAGAEKGFGVAVPTRYGQKAMHVVSSIAPLAGSGAAPRSDCGQGAGACESADLLKISYVRLAAAGERARDGLIELIVKGSPVIKKKAAKALVGAVHSGDQAACRLMKVALEKEELETVNILLSVLREVEYRVDDWRDFLPHPAMPDAVRIKALEILGHVGTIEAVPAVTPLLDDPAPEVRDEADNTLCLLTDQDMGFDGLAPLEERRRSIQRWRDWWEAR